MKFFKNFFRFRKDIDIFEQNKPNVAQDVDRVVGGMGEEKLDIKAKGKNRLDYSKKAKETEEMWKGKNYDTQWKPFVDDNLNDPKTFDKVVDFLKNYQGQKNAPVIKKILTDAEKKEKSGQGSVKDRVKELATEVMAAMGITGELRYLEARNEVVHAHSDHSKIKRVFGIKDSDFTTLPVGLKKMADWAKVVGARKSGVFENIEI